MEKQQLESRLIDFAVMVISASDDIKKNTAGIYLTDQIIRSGTSPALNYGESRSAESTRDFIHKLQIVLKELRETHVALRIILKSKTYKKGDQIKAAEDECDQLISIFVKSIQTTRKKLKKKLST